MSDSVEHRPILGPGMAKPVGPYSPGVAFDRLIFVSGQGPHKPDGELPGLDVESQTEQVFKNIEAILEASGSSLKHVLRCGVFLADIREFSKMNAVYERMMDGNRAARTTVEVSALPLEGMRVEIDAIAYIPGES